MNEFFPKIKKYRRPIAISLATLAAGISIGYTTGGRAVSVANAAERDRASAAAASTVALNAQSEACDVYLGGLKRDASEVAALMLGAANTTQTGMTIDHGFGKSVTLNRASQKQVPSESNAVKNKIVTFVVSIAFDPENIAFSGKSTVKVSSAKNEEMVSGTWFHESVGSQNERTVFAFDESAASDTSKSSIDAAVATGSPLKLAEVFEKVLNSSSPDAASLMPLTISEGSSSGSSLYPATQQDCMGSEVVFEALKEAVVGEQFVGSVANQAVAALPTTIKI